MSMILSGTVMKSIPGSYTNRTTGVAQAQLEAVIWPDDPEARDSIIVRFDHTYFADPLFMQNMAALEGKPVTVPVRIFSFKNGGFILVAKGLPVAAKAPSVAPASPSVTPVPSAQTDKPQGQPEAKRA